MRKVVWALALAVVLGCGNTAQQGRLPTEAEARQFLDHIVTTARAKDFVALCAFGDANCSDMLASAGPAVPSAPPTVAGIRTVEAVQRPDGSATSGGVLLQLCGVDGNGTRYASEMLVIRTGSGLKAIQPIYWSNMRVSDGSAVGAEDPLVFAGCP